jgi:hypothetical protein
VTRTPIFTISIRTIFHEPNSVVQQPSPHNPRVNKNVAISYGYFTAYKSTTLKVANALTTALAPNTLTTPVLEEEVSFTPWPLYRRQNALVIQWVRIRADGMEKTKNLLALTNSSVLQAVLPYSSKVSHDYSLMLTS